MKHKNQPDIRPFTRQFYRGNRRYLALGMIQTLFSAAGALMISWLMQQIIDRISGLDRALPFGRIALLSLLTLVLLLVGYGFAYISRPKFINKAMVQYRTYVFGELSKKSIAAFSGENTATYISALSNDANTIESGYLSGIFVLLEQSILFLGALGLMLWYSPALTLISIALAAVPLAVSLLTGNLVAKAETVVSQRNEGYMSMLRDSLTGFSVIKAFQAEAQLGRLFARSVQQVAEAKERRMKRALIVEMVSTTAGTVLQFGVFLIGAYLALSGGQISGGTVLAFLQLLNYVLNPIGTIPQTLAERKAARALIQKLAAALRQHVREDGGEAIPALSDGIEVKDLSFAYEPEKPVLQHINFRFEAGKSYCIVGASGSGKTTLLHLLMDASSAYDGQILYDGHELRTLSGESLYGLVSLVQQTVFVFNASIRDNITMFADFPKGAVDRAIALSGLSSLIAEKGEDYQCGENGSGLSGGEKQRIAIARSLLKKSQVLLADEATAALDAQTAYQVSAAILGLRNMTRIVVTHGLDKQLLSRYDCILAFHHGTLVEAGGFDELIAQKGYFYSLYTVSQ